ncbi:stage II sporulation protein E [Alicyclobacillus sp. SO9]|nr:stage II sporulation protein E [Alicyclobacillus sp. SO9]
MKVQVVFRALLLLLISWLLGRATIGHVISPFALAFFAVSTEVFGVKRSWPVWAAVAGTYGTYGFGQALTLLFEFTLYLLLRKALFRKSKPDLHWMPFLAGLIDIVSRLVASHQSWSRYHVFLSLAEGALVAVLSLIFLQCMPLFNLRKSQNRLRTDQLLSITIFVGSVMTGLTGMVFHNVSALAVGTDVIVMVMAAAGGVGVSATVGIVVGVLAMLDHSLTLSQVAILGFAGMLSGALKETGRMFIALAFAGSEAALTITLHTSWSAVAGTIGAALVAGVLLNTIPSQSLSRLAEFIPGTYEHNQTEKQSIKRVRKLLQEKITEISKVFDELSVTFAETESSDWIASRKLVDETISESVRQVCTGCPLRSKCWDQEGLATYQALMETISRFEESKTGYRAATQELKDRCVRLDPMLNVLRRNADLSERDAKWLKKVNEQAGLVSAQLSGVASVIRSVAHHVERETEASLAGEEEILASLEQLGLYVDNVRIVNLDPGKVEIEVTQPSQGAYENSVRMIAPLLSGIVGENIGVAQVETSDGGPCTSVFTSARLYDVKAAVSTVARDGRLVSGDSHASLDLGNGRFALAVSDGMGNGERAHRESNDALELLKRLLQTGFDQQLAVKTVNSTLLLRSRDEIFTTLDMALIDLYSAQAEFLKIGSAPSFIKRNQEVRSITGASVPIGILQEIEVQSIDEQLQGGDLLILLSDGVYDAAKHVYNQEDWLKRQIEKLETNDPQEIADTLIETAVRVNHGQILDDMTVLVAVIDEHQPEWAAIRVPGVVGLRQQNPSRKERGA